MSIMCANFTRYTAIIGITLITIYFILCLAGLRFNTTNSVPKGFYWKLNTPVVKGEYVLFCPPQTQIVNLGKEHGYIQDGHCEGNYSYMIKRVAAIQGDKITIHNDGVWINGVHWKHSQLRSADQYNRHIPRLKRPVFILNRSEIFLMGETLKSFDGRYFGAIPKTQIKYVLYPILTW